MEDIKHMEDIISQAKAELVRTKDQMAHALATTPDDRINWSPSSTARTPVQQVGHGANSLPGIQGMLTGKPFPYKSIAEFEAALRAADAEFTGREQVLALLEKNTSEYLAWLDTVTPSQLAATVQPPFGPPVPMAVAVTFAAYHLRAHVAQMDYIQTIYGDRDWHMGS